MKGVLRTSISSERLRTALQSRYPTLRVKVLTCASDGQRLELVGTRTALLEAGVAQEAWLPLGRFRASRGVTEFGDRWSLSILRGGRLALTLELGADRPDVDHLSCARDRQPRHIDE
jgi:hypothetical protein